MSMTTGQMLTSLAAALEVATPLAVSGRDDHFSATCDLPDMARLQGVRAVIVSAVPSRDPLEMVACGLRETLVTLVHSRPDAPDALLDVLDDADVLLDAAESWATANDVILQPELGTVDMLDGQFVATRQMRVRWDR